MAAPSLTPPIFIAGPTAAGKSEVALRLAERVGGEIISIDSMQVYRGLDIGTAKPSPADRARVPHHLIDVVDLSEPFDAAKFCELAKPAAREIQARGHVPVFCGGTGLYFKAYLCGLGNAPATDPRLRAELEASPIEDLLRELAERDPVAYERIDRRNPRRVIRALEVMRLTGQPFSALRADWSAECGVRSAEFEGRMTGRFLILTRPATELHVRINARVEEMFRRGLVEETRTLLARGLEQNRTAMQAIGYRQVVEHLRGERSLPETIELVKLRTRQFAKRQMMWFRGQAMGRIISLVPGADPDAAAQQIASLCCSR